MVFNLLWNWGIFFNLQWSWGLIEQWEVASTNANACLPTLPSVVMQEFCALFLHTTFHKKWQWQGLRGQNVLKYGWTRQILHMTHHQLTSFSLVKRYFFACHIGFSWLPNCISHIDESTKSYQTSVVCFNGVALDCSFESSKAQSPSRGE